MDKAASKERATKLAESLMGVSSADAKALDVINEGAFVGQRANDDRGTVVTKKAKATEVDLEEEELDDQGEDDPDDDEIPDDDQDDLDDDDDSNPDDGDDDQQDELDDDEGADGSDEDDGGNYEEVQYSDDDVLEVTVDGAPVEVTLRELKKNYSGKAAIEKRLQEATTVRNTATTERVQGQQKIATEQAALFQAIASLDEVIFHPMVSEPDPALRRTNSTQYLLQKDAYEADQKRIEIGRQKLTQVYHQRQQSLAKERADFAAAQAQLLVQKLPEIADPALQKEVYGSIVAAANYYGFSNEEIQQAADHRMFVMARDAAKWRKYQEMKKNGKPPLSGVKKVKRLRTTTGKTASALKAQAVAKSKNNQDAETRAKRTGKVDDVTAFLTANVRTQGKPNGRRG